MPASVTLYLVGVWSLVGFFVGAGWTLGAWFVGRVVSSPAQK